MPIESFFGHHPDRKDLPPQRYRASIYSGQGTQTVGMGHDLSIANAYAAKIYGIADKILGFPISTISFEGPEEKLNLTVNAQPATFIYNYICDRLLTQQSPEFGQREMVAGHSLGEYNALVAAGVLSFKDALLLVGERARAMGRACQENKGGMIVVQLGERDSRLEEMIARFGVKVSIVNSNEQTILAGTDNGIDESIRWIKEQKITGARLRGIEGGFHSDLMDPAAKSFSKTLRHVTLKPAKIPLVGNTTASLIRNPEEIRRELANQINHPVLWKESLKLMAQKGIGQTIEIGEKGILSNMNLKVNGGKIERLRRFVTGAAINFVVWERQPQPTPSIA